MKKYLILLALAYAAVTGCKTVYSTTSIEPNQSFVLGDNEHNAFEIDIKNISDHDLELLKMPNGGKKQLIQVLKVSNRTNIKIEKNTALYVQNSSDQKVSVELILKGDTGLSMGYKDRAGQ